MNNKKPIIIISIIVTLGLVGAGLWLFAANRPAPQPSTTSTQDQPDTGQSAGGLPSGDGTPVQRTDQELNTYLVDNEPSLTNPNTNLPVFTITKTKQPLAGWYVVTLRHTSEDTSDATVILRDVGGKLTKVAGPGTGLFDNTSLPPEVRKAAQEE